MSSSTISRSTNSSGRSRRSTSVTCTPRAANIDAYSIPMTPAPTTASAREDGLAEGLAGDRAGVGAHSAHAATLLDHRGPAAELGGLHRGALAGGAAADRHELEVVVRRHGRAPPVGPGAGHAGHSAL